MKSSKLIIILESLTKVEMTRLDKYVHSPYFHVHEDTVRLFEYLHSRYPGFKEKHIRQEVVFKALFPNRPFQKSRLYTIKGYLLKLVYDFLADQASHTYFSQRKKQDLLLALSNRNLHKLIPRIIQDCENELEEYPHRDTHFYREAFQLEDFHAHFQIGYLNRSKDPVFQNVADGLDKYYLVEKLRYACAMINHQQILAINYRYDLLEEVLGYCSQLNFDEYPMIGSYYLAFLMQNEEHGDSYFRQLKLLLERHVEKIPAEEALSLYTLCTNHCNRRYKSGAQEFLREMFDIYKQMLSQGLLFTKNASGILYYKNIVTIGLKLFEYEWTEHFIRTYKDILDIQHRESMFNYSLALLSFQKQEYRKCTRHLLQVAFVDDFNRLNYYILLLKTYYESDEIEPLISMCHTALTYIRRNKSLSAKNKSAYINFVKFVRTMARIRFNGSKDQPELHTEIEDCTLLVERKWLLEKSENYLTTTIS